MMMHAAVASQMLARSRCSARGLISGTSHFRRHAVLAASAPSSSAASADPPPAASGRVVPVTQVVSDKCRPHVGTMQARLSKNTSCTPGIGIFCGRRFLSSASASEAAGYFDGPWHDKYLLLEEYKKEHGNCLVPQSHLIGDVQLGRWVSDQRYLCNKGKLSADRRGLLDSLGFSWDPLADKWESNFALLERFQEREGHSNVPIHHEEDGLKLGTWLDTQRQNFKKGWLDDSFEQRLEAAGISWDPLADKWERNFALLEHFNEREGHGNAPHSHEEDGVKIGIWVVNQRQLYKTGRLDKSYQWRLENLGMSWDPLEDKWEQNFALLEQYKKREGHGNAPQSHEGDGVKLGSWLSKQRHMYKKGKLDESYMQRLEAAGISWDPIADQWERNFTLLKKYKKREGHSNVPKTHEEDGVKLGKWISRQRQLYKKGKLDVSYQHCLENLGMSWDPLAEQWEHNLALLKRFIKREGHSNVPKTHEEDEVKLGMWLSTQRQARKGNLLVPSNLSSDRIERLDQVGMRW